MPQPLSTFDRIAAANQGAHISIGGLSSNYGVPNQIFFGKEQFASLSMDVIARWSTLEMTVLLTMARLVGGPTKGAFSTYAELRSKNAKTPAIKIIAKLTIGVAQHKLVDRIFKFYDACEKSRNTIAHHTWGFFHNRNDAILLVDPVDLINRTGDLAPSKVFVWRVSDFIELTRKLHELTMCVDSMSGLRNDQEDKKTYEANIDLKLKMFSF